MSDQAVQLSYDETPRCMYAGRQGVIHMICSLKVSDFVPRPPKIFVRFSATPPPATILFTHTPHLGFYFWEISVRIITQTNVVLRMHSTLTVVRFCLLFH